MTKTELDEIKGRLEQPGYGVFDPGLRTLRTIGDIAALIECVEELEAENTRLREVVVELREALETKSEATARAALARAKEVLDG